MQHRTSPRHPVVRMEMKKMLPLLSSVFVVLLITCMQAAATPLAQDVTGVVRDAQGAPVEGASVFLQPLSKGTVTDKDGRFTFTNIDPGTYTLEISYVGFETQSRSITVKAGSTAPISITLQRSDSKTEAAVVVTAFGVTQQKRALGYSVQEVKAQALTESHQPNLVNALQGKVAGVTITNSSGAPGASSVMLIRGGTSLSNNNQPLYIIDGIPVDNSTQVSQGTNLVAQSAPASNRAIDINPEDIQSITVLKGPSAAALYGLRAASGAVIITTKKGVAGKTSLNYSGSFSVDKVNRLPDLQSTYKQGEQGVFSPTATWSWGPKFNPSDTIYDNLGDFFRTGITQRHDVSASGGNDRTTFYASASLFDQDGIVRSTDFTRKSFRLNADTKVGNKLKVGGNVSYTRTDRQYVLQGKGIADGSGVNTANGGGTMLGVIFWPRNDNMKNYLTPDGRQRTIIGADNPYWSIRNNPITDDVDRMTFIGNVVYDPFSFLNITYRMGTDYFTNNFTSVRNTGTTILTEEKGAISQFSRKYRITTSTLLITAKHSFKDINASFTVGNNAESENSQTEFWYGRNFIGPNFPSINNTNTNDRSVSQGISRRRIVGVFGDLSLDWKGIVYLNFRGRNDWSSTVRVEDQSFFYPAISTSVVLTDLLNELGAKVNSGILSYAKIRASWARVGKDAPPHVLATTLANATNTFTINPRGFILNSNTYFGNPLLRPEFTNSLELGTELRFLDNRLGLDLTWYRTVSDDQILGTRTPPTSGSFLAFMNGGSIENKGVELMVNTVPVKTNDFNWALDLNFAKNEATVKSLPGSLDRVELSDAWAAGNVAQGAAFLNGTLFGINGNVWKRDASGQLLLDNRGYPQVQSTLKMIGDRNPDWVGGITNTLTYKNFSLAFMWDVRIGGDIYNATENYLVRSGQSLKTLDRGQTKVFDGIIESSGAKNTTAVALDQNFYQTLYPNEGDFFVEDGAWYRMRYATFTWTLPKKFIGRTPFSNMQLSATGRNLILISDYSGIDPEVSGSGAGVAGTGSFGFDNLGIPATKGFDFTLKLTL
jgi:TonB-linked SusC/RagA family outer membrane protein